MTSSILSAEHNMSMTADGRMAATVIIQTREGLCMQALRSSIYYVDDVDEADVVVVDDYCYYVWWLGHVHTTNNHDDHDAGAASCLCP